ncbi:MAG TPA: hypothetical protein DHW02_03940 [Ktedonobacter sp.]|nr:hypothetical protein [Ktedonobacter sp.]
MHTPEDERDIFPEMPDDEQVHITDLDSPDVPSHPVTRFWRRFPLTSLSPRARTCLSIATGVVTIALLIVFLVVSILPTLQLSGAAQNQSQGRNHVPPYLTYPLDMSVVGNSAYVITSANSILALNLSNGSALWQYRPDEQPLQPLIIANDTVFFMTINENLNVPEGSIYALNMRDGRLLWNRTLPALNPAVGPIDVQQGIILLSVGNTLYALRASNGSTAWTYNTGYLPAEYMLLDANDGRAYLNSQFGDIFALDVQTGRVVWHYAVDNQHFSLTQAVNGIVYATSQDGTYYAIQATTGRPLWHFTGSTGKNLAGALLTVLGDTIYLSTSDGTMNALRISDGKLLWKYKQSGTIWEAPIASSNIVYLSSQLGVIDALQVDTGKLLWHYKSADSETALASIDNQYVYVVSRNGVLNVLKANDGSHLWQYAQPSIAQGSPTVSNGIVLMRFSNGLMYALRESDGKLLWQIPISMFGSGFILVLGDTIFIGAPQGGVSALRLNDGSQVWHYTTA